MSHINAEPWTLDGFITDLEELAKDYEASKNISPEYDTFMTAASLLRNFQFMEQEFDEYLANNYPERIEQKYEEIKRLRKELEAAKWDINICTESSCSVCKNYKTKNCAMNCDGSCEFEWRGLIGE